MEKKGMLIVIFISILLVITALNIVSFNFAGLETGRTIQPEIFDQIIKSAKETAEPKEMIDIYEIISVQIEALEDMEREPEKPIRAIVCFTEEAVEEESEKIPKELIASKIIPPVISSSTVPPFKIEEIIAMQTEIAKEQKAIEILQKKFESIPKEKFEVVHNLTNIPCSIVYITKEAISKMIELKLPTTVVKDEQYELQIHEAIELIEADDVWKRQAAEQQITGKGINVAIIDSGIDYMHPDLGGCIGPECKVVDGWNTLGDNENVIDRDGHGTHLAGIIASVAPDANLIAVKSCQGGFCSASEIAEAIDWCLDNNCHAATLSLGDGGSHSPNECKKLETLRPAFNAAKDRNLAIFVSSGNKGKTWPSYPACDAEVISVGSVNDYDDKISDFSNLHPDILAPGVSIRSTWLNDDYTIMAGTSQSAAFAAAAAALYIQSYAALKKETPTPLIIEENLETSGDLIYDEINNANYPRINVAALINDLIGEEPLPSFVCGNFRCEFELGEDAQNCPVDCKAKIPIIAIGQNHTLSLDIRNWEGVLTPVRIEIRGRVQNKIFVKDFMYDYYTTSVELPEGVYDVKLGYGSFSAILRSINLNKSLNLEIKLEELTRKIKEIPEYPYAQIKASYALGFEKSAIVCFDRKLAENDTFVFRCPWNGSCKEDWNTLMSMTPRETSCILLIPREGTAFAVAEIPEVCGNGICEFGEDDISCPQDCKLKAASLKVEDKKTFWPMFMIFMIAAVIIVIGIYLKRKKQRQKLLDLLTPPKPPKIS